MSTSAFVEQLYMTFLGRPADDAGRAYWSNAIDAGVLTAAELTRNFVESAEFADAVAPLVRLYYSAFDRIPDAGGLSFWLQQAQAGTPLDTIAEAFVMTAEFAEVYGAARNADFIDLIYQNALDRAPDASGKAYWLEQLAQGQASRADVLTAIANSGEMAAATGNAVKVIAQYHGITGSAPTQQQIDSALQLDEPLALINQLFASSRYTGAPVPHPFVTDSVKTSQGGGGTVIDSMNKAPVIDFDLSTPADDATSGVSVTPNIVLVFSQDVFAASGMIYITDGAAQTVIDRATGLPKVRIVGATDTRAIDVNDSAHVSIDGERVTLTVASALKSGVTYSVLVGKGVLEGANDMPFGGISDSTTLNFTPFGDSTPPEVVAFALDRSSLNSGHTATMTIEFSEAVQAPDKTDFIIPNGDLSNFASADGGRTWTALFTPTANQVNEAANFITLRGGSVPDLAGNFTSGDFRSNNYAIDTMVTPVVDSALEFNDTGISAGDKLTNDPTQTLSGRFVGAPSGTTLRIVVNGDSHDVTPNVDNTWAFNAGQYVEGLNTVMAYFTNPAGNRSAERSLSFVLDTAGPVTELADTIDPATPLVITFSEAVFWTNPEAEIVLTSANGNVSFGRGDLVISEDGMTITVASGSMLLPGTSYTMTLPAALTDAAGNGVSGPLEFGTLPSPDLTPPPVPSIVDMLAASDSGTLNTDNITRDTLPQFTGTLGVEGDTVKLFADEVEVGSATVGAGGAWTVAPNNALAEGNRSITVRFEDPAGNVSDAAPALGIKVDTTAPAITGTTPLEGGITSGDVKLTFSEHINFVHGSIKLTGLLGGLLNFIGVDQGAAWEVSVSQTNPERSVLTVNPDISLGEYTLTLEADSIVDIAGNAYAEIIGTPVLTFHLSLL